MSCCGMPRKSDEPEYTMPQPLARLASSWEQGCPGIMRALHEEIATGDWDRQQAGFVPAYAPDKACHVALAVLEQTLRGNFTRHQHLHGPWYVRWGLSKASTDLPPASMAFLEAAREYGLRSTAPCTTSSASLPQRRQVIVSMASTTHPLRLGS